MVKLCDSNHFDNKEVMRNAIHLANAYPGNSLVLTLDCNLWNRVIRNQKLGEIMGRTELSGTTLA